MRGNFQIVIDLSTVFKVIIFILIIAREKYSKLYVGFPRKQDLDFVCPSILILDFKWNL